ncbi:MAG: hypothetical protein ABJG41_20835 [Cyclobacteriaceae bacterium]
MGSLTKAQIDQVKMDLDAQGISFNPLKEELLDHIVCDIELKMDEGIDFDAAWASVHDQIPEDHFRNIQKETMELLNRKFNPVRISGVISGGLLAAATIFKMLHLPGAGLLLLIFLVGSCVTLVVGSARSIYVYREARGRGAIALGTLLIIAFIAGLCFRVLHLPGASVLMATGVLGLSVLFPLLSVYFFRSKQKLRGHLLIRLIEDNQRVIERVALVLIGFGLVFNYSSLLLGIDSFVGVIFFIFACILTGLYVYSLTWSYFVNRDGSNQARDLVLLVASSVALVLFLIPAVGFNINFLLRQYAAFSALVIFDLIVLFYYSRFSDSPNKKILAPLASFLTLYPLVRLGIKLQWFEGFLGGLTTNNTFIISFLIFLIALLIGFRKEGLFRALIILTIASHMIPNL